LEAAVTVTGIITAIVFGLIIGALARLIVPGKQNFPIWLTILVGIVGALIGTFVARALNFPTGGFNWREILLQIIAAVILVFGVAAVYKKRA
jgi:uncharacterized membrane protein YeaQ/YmgE (transglycosylase-associated protein family)